MHFKKGLHESDVKMLLKVNSTKKSFKLWLEDKNV